MNGYVGGREVSGPSYLLTQKVLYAGVIRFAESNRRQAERRRELVARLDASMLAVRLPNGWTVAVAHIADWDRQRLCLMRRWAAGNGSHGGYDGELFNEVLLPFLESIWLGVSPGPRLLSWPI